MAPKGGVHEGQQTLSSFFRPAPAPTKRTNPVIDGVLILEDSDDDDPTRARANSSGPLKRVKTEHATSDSQLQPVASTSTLAPTSSAATPAPPPSQRLAAFAYTHEAAPQPPRTRTPETQRRHDDFVKRLSLGPDLLKRGTKSSYLQKDHYLAARDDDDDDGSPGLGAFDEDDEGASSEGASSSSAARGKGKGRAVEDDSEPSRFSKFAKKGSAAAKKDAAPAGGKVKYTPLEQQVLALRKANPGVLLIVEVGYKFRFFGEDAQAASRVLNIACFPSQHMLTASIPTHRLDFHVKRLLNAGYKVGVVRQQETAALKKASDNRSAPFTRALSALYTSATYVDALGGAGGDALPGAGQGGETATLMCVVEDAPAAGTKGGGKGADARVRIGVVAVVPSTGTVVYDEFDDTLMRAELETRMLHLQPSELLLQKDLSSKTEAMVKYLAGQYAAGRDDFSARVDRIAKRPTAAQATSTIAAFFAKKPEGKGKGKGKGKEVEREPSEIVLSSDDEDEGTPAMTPGPDGQPAAILDLPKLVLIALASLLTHLEPFGLARVFTHASAFTPFASRAAMTLNGNTVANLELLRNSTDFREAGSLVGVLDRCKTAMGRRMLRRWVTKPLLSLELIKARHDALSAIHAAHASLHLSKLRDLLRTLPDLERGLARIHLGRAAPAELLRVLEAFVRAGRVFEDAESEDGGEGQEDVGVQSELLKGIVKDLPRVRGTAEALLAHLDAKAAREGDKEALFVDEGRYPALQAAKEGLARTVEGMHDELKAARKLLRKPALQFTKVSQEEYLFEVKIAEAKAVPADWVRINATKQVHRYRSPALQKKLDKLEQWKEKVAAAANDAFLAFLREVASHYELFRQTIVSLATADCLFSLALVALDNNWARPTLVAEAGTFDVKGARHPIIEAVSHEPFVPNDVEFREGKMRSMLLTGLNMGGKSSLARSIALIALLAQMGSFVPAESATLSLFDGIFTRMGASDDLARGRSTFMVELSETSTLLRAATSRSLLLLDELGRGTSTHDGLAIAHAVLSHLALSTRATTVFVTHYPALGALARAHPREVRAMHMACREDEAGEEGEPPRVTFLYQLVPGLASASHGLNVARLAEIPEEVVRRAKDKGEEMARVEKARVARRRERRLAEVLRRAEAIARGGAEGKEGEEALEMCREALVQ
ncbi:Mismatch repair protein msh3 [Rhodotorula kratochvilovae]